MKKRLGFILFLLLLPFAGWANKFQTLTVAQFNAMVEGASRVEMWIEHNFYGRGRMGFPGQLIVTGVQSPKLWGEYSFPSRSNLRLNAAGEVTDIPPDFPARFNIERIDDVVKITALFASERVDPAEELYAKVEIPTAIAERLTQLVISSHSASIRVDGNLGEHSATDLLHVMMGSSDERENIRISSRWGTGTLKIATQGRIKISLEDGTSFGDGYILAPHGTVYGHRDLSGGGYFSCDSSTLYVLEGQIGKTGARLAHDLLHQEVYTNRTMFTPDLSHPFHGAFPGANKRYGIQPVSKQLCGSLFGSGSKAVARL